MLWTSASATALCGPFSVEKTPRAVFVPPISPANNISMFLPLFGLSRGFDSALPYGRASFGAYLHQTMANAFTHMAYVHSDMPHGHQTKRRDRKGAPTPHTARCSA